MAKAVVLLFASGCMVQSHALVRGSHGRLDGGAIGGETVSSMGRFGVEMGYEQVRDADDDEHRGAAGVDYIFRFGLVAALLESRCETVCDPKPWLDFGPAVGLGFAASADVTLHGHSWTGGWADVRLSPSSAYPVLRVELQRDWYSGSLRGDTQISIGLGYVTDSDVRW